MQCGDGYYRQWSSHLFYWMLFGCIQKKHHYFNAELKEKVPKMQLLWLLHRFEIEIPRPYQKWGKKGIQYPLYCAELVIFVSWNNSISCWFIPFPTPNMFLLAGKVMPGGEKLLIPLPSISLYILIGSVVTLLIFEWEFLILIQFSRK